MSHEKDLETVEKCVCDFLTSYEAIGPCSRTKKCKKENRCDDCAVLANRILPQGSVIVDEKTLNRIAAEKDVAEDQKYLYEMALFEVIRQAFILPLGRALKKTDEEIADKVFETIDETFKTLDKNGIAAEMLKSSRYKNIPVGEQRPVKEDDRYCDKCVRKATGACSSCITTEHPSGRISRPSHFLSKDEAK